MSKKTKILDLLNELESLIETGNTLPFSSKSLISSEDALEILDELKDELPKEIEEAQSIVNQKQQILLEAQQEADNIRNTAQNEVREMIDANEVTRLANNEAEKILTNAQNSAKEIRIGTQEYAFTILDSLEKKLKILNDEVQKNKDDLKVMN